MSFSYDVCRRIPDPLEPYGDIAGLGVILAFVISAWLTILILVAYYIFVFDPHTDPFSSTNSTTTYSPNPFDVLLANYTKHIRIRKSFHGSLAEHAFHKVSNHVHQIYFCPVYMSKCILSLADAQLFTGISILVSGYMSLKHDRGLSAYHWKMVISLAWFSSITHLSALSFLRSYLAKHPRRRLWRLMMMLVLLVLLLVGFIPTGHFNFLGGQLDTDGRLDSDADQLQYSRLIDLGQSMYPEDCEDHDKSQYYFKFFTWRDLMNLDSELLRNGTIGPANCTISGKRIFKPPEKSSDNTFNFYQERYLRLIENVDEGDQEAEVAILYESAAVCYFKAGMRTSTDAFVSMISSLLLLIYGYLIRASKTFEASNRLISQQIQSALDREYEKWMRKWERLLSRRSAPVITVTAMCLLPLQASVYCTFRVLLHLYTSMFAEVFSVLFSAIWGTLSIKQIKNISSSDLYEENDWTFGQIIAIALLSSSLLPIFDLFYQLTFNKAEHQRREGNDGSLQNASSVENPREVNSNSNHDRYLDNTPVPAEASSNNITEIETTDNEGFNCSSQSSTRLRPLNSHYQISGLNDSATNQVGLLSSSLEHASPVSSRLINRTEHPGTMRLRIERRLQESTRAYEQAWTRSTIFIMSGPLIFAILRLLPETRFTVAIAIEGVMGPWRYRLPTAHLVSSAKMLACLPCLIQQYIYCRLQINRLTRSTNRLIFVILLVMLLTGASIILCIFVDVYYILLGSVGTGFVCEGIVISSEFLWLSMQILKERKREAIEL